MPENLQPIMLWGVQRNNWDKIFPDTMMTVAAIDRLVHHGVIIEIQADSFRRKQAMERNPPVKAPNDQSTKEDCR